MFRLRAFAAGLAVAAVVVLTSVVPASAHDQLLSSSPSEGEKLPSAPDEISLSFSADVLQMGAEVVVADGDGTDWVATDPQIRAGAVTVLLKGGMPDAGYEVRWRVVSSDGHPISGVIPFTVGDAAPLERVAVDPVPAASSGTASEARDDGAGIPRIVGVAAIGAGAALVVFVVFFFLSRRAGRDAHS